MVLDILVAYVAAVLVAVFSFVKLQISLTFPDEHGEGKVVWLILFIIFSIITCWSLNWAINPMIYSATLILFLSALFSAIAVFFYSKEYHKHGVWNDIVFYSSLFIVTINAGIFFSDKRALFLDFTLQSFNIAYVIVFVFVRLTEFRTQNN